MPKVQYCPCCGYDFRNKNWVKESNNLMVRYNEKTTHLIKNVIKIANRYENNYPEDIYKFLKGLSTLEEHVVFEGCKTYLTNKYHHSKGLNYCKYIALNLDKNEEKIVNRIRKTIGGKSVPLKDE